MKDILCTTDFTAASDTAMFHALRIADRAGSHVTLLHVVDKGGEKAKEEALARMAEQINGAGAQGRVTPLVLEGHFMERIAEESARDHQMVVLGTHGPRGLRQNLFGADILKLVRLLAIPAFVVQEKSPRTELLERIVMPVAAHSNMGKMLDMVCTLARLCAAEVLVYQLMRPNEEPSEDLLANKRDMLYRLQEENLRHQEVNEPSTIFSVSFAEPTIRFAERINAGCIAIMAHASDEYRYIADAEKERMLTNEACIPVLCA
jgi:nucleotide-binding universal stress UspA family protein